MLLGRDSKDTNLQRVVVLCRATSRHEVRGDAEDFGESLERLPKLGQIQLILPLGITAFIADDTR